MAAADPVLGTCQCDIPVGRPCGAAITEEDLLCDNCRAARLPGMIHGSLALSGPTVTTASHFAIDLREHPLPGRASSPAVS